jgi:putative FmdB family regulatory protein
MTEQLIGKHGAACVWGNEEMTHVPRQPTSISTIVRYQSCSVVYRPSEAESAMPLFDFHCQSCDKTSELLIRGSQSNDVAKCPHCGSTQMDKLLSIPAAPGQSKGIIQRARAQANKEGHFSNFSAGERSKILKT